MKRKDTYSLYKNNDDRFFTITFKGAKKLTKKSNYTLRVSYDNLSSTINYLHKKGAIITNITLISSGLSVKNESNSLTQKSFLKKAENFASLPSQNILSSLPLGKKSRLRKRKLSRLSSRLTRRDKSRLKNLRHKRKHS